MKIAKKDGSLQAFMPNKILTRIKTQSKELKIDVDKLFQKVVPHITDGMTTTEIDEVIAFRAADLQIEHPDYSMLGGRILMSRQSKLTGLPLKEVDTKLDFFSASTFLSNYSKKDSNKRPVELPSTMYERVAAHLHDSLEEREILEKELSDRKINFATPIYTNAGIEGRNSLISCQVVFMEDDSISGINNTLDKISHGSKEGSGIGLCIDNIRSSKSLVSTFNDYAGGIVRLADMVQSHMRFYKQGSRAGSCALYLSTWHKDVIDFLHLRLPVGEEKMRARDLFTAITVDDVFMNCLLEEKDYYLFCPNDIKKAGLKPLYDTWGEEFEEVYNKAVELGLGEKIDPKKIWDAIIKSQVESGTPYVFYKDNANRKNMQVNIGTIRQSQLCVTADTKILTSEGHLEIGTLENKEVEVWNGEEWSKTTVFKTGENQEIIEVHTSSGQSVKSTPYHHYYRSNGERVEAKDLKVGDELIKFKLPDGKKVEGIKVTAINKVEGLHDTYCFTEPKRNMGMFNGILTGQCIEITLASKARYSGQCTLASINLGAHDTLESIYNSTRILNRALNKVIDKNKWSDDWAKEAGVDQRNIAIGVAGLADFFAKKKISFESEEAKKWNEDIFRTMYQASVEESMSIAEATGENYPAWEGSPYSKGETYIEGWSPKPKGEPIPVVNSLFLGLMPTASSAILLGVYESFQPIDSNLFTRTVGKGEFLIINKYLVSELIELGLWNQDMINKLIVNDGSIQDIYEIPEDIRTRYKTVWEIPQKALLDLAIIRNKYVDQSQSMNVYHKDAKYSKISSALVYAWKNGLKTGVYYTRTKAKSDKSKKLAVTETVTKRPENSMFNCTGCEA